MIVKRLGPAQRRSVEDLTRAAVVEQLQNGPPTVGGGPLEYLGVNVVVVDDLVIVTLAVRQRHFETLRFTSHDFHLSLASVRSVASIDYAGIAYHLTYMLRWHSHSQWHTVDEQRPVLIAKPQPKNRPREVQPAPAPKSKWERLLGEDLI